jgi:hypothetical protein
VSALAEAVEKQNCRELFATIDGSRLEKGVVIAFRDLELWPRVHTDAAKNHNADPGADLACCRGLGFLSRIKAPVETLGGISSEVISQFPKKVLTESDRRKRKELSSAL